MKGGVNESLEEGKSMRIVWGSVFVIIGAVLLFYPQIEREVYNAKQKELVEVFERVGMVEEEQSVVRKEKEVQLNGAKGVIRIPKIELEMLVFDGATNNILRNGAGIIEPEKEFGVHNVGIAGHRAIARGKQFNRLGELEPNDEIEIQTKSGSYQFVVVKTFVVDKTDVSVLNDKKEPYITLVTCTPIGKKNPTERLIVQAKLN